MDNYPPGAAHDPRAPYNQQEPPETDVLAQTRLVKLTTVSRYNDHIVDDYHAEHRTAFETLRDCEIFLSRLIANYHLQQQPRLVFGRISAQALLEDCKDWEELEFDVTEP